MNRTIAVVACLGMASCLQTPSLAATSSPTAVDGFRATQPKLTAGEHTVAAVYVNSRDPDLSIPAFTDVTLDETVVRCSKPTCTLALSAMQEVGTTTTANEQWAIHVLVDGQSVDGGPWQGALSTAYLQIGNWQGKFIVAKGKHTITWQTIGEASYTIFQWSDTATVLVP